MVSSSRVRVLPTSISAFLLVGICSCSMLAAWIVVYRHFSPPPDSPQHVELEHSLLRSKLPSSFRVRQTKNNVLMAPKIPHRLIFTSKHNILETKEPVQFYRNIQRTIQRYRQAWGEPDAPVWFLNDTECRSVIQEAHGGDDLVGYFDREIHGKFRGDICRVAALYLKGGYYFDIDIEVVRPVLLSGETTFSTARMQIPHDHEFFQAFLAVEPGSPILKKSFEEMVNWYVHPETRGGSLNMGTTTLGKAYDKVPEVNRTQVRLLEEILLSVDRYPDLPRHDGVGCCCNFVVHDAQEQQVYFYSRIVDAGEYCMASSES